MCSFFSFEWNYVLLFCFLVYLIYRSIVVKLQLLQCFKYVQWVWEVHCSLQSRGGKPLILFCFSEAIVIYFTSIQFQNKIYIGHLTTHLANEGRRTLGALPLKDLIIIWYFFCPAARQWHSALLIKEASELEGFFFLPVKQFICPAKTIIRIRAGKKSVRVEWDIRLMTEVQGS